MEIKKPNSRPLTRRIKILFALLVLFILIPVLIRNILKDPAVKKVFKQTTTTAGPIATQLEDLQINISRKNYHKLSAKRDEALGRYSGKGSGILLTSDDDLVKANLLYKDENYKGEIRLKGDWTQHIEGDTWSFRVKLNNEKTIEGMRKFSLQHPQTRNYAGEWLFHELLKKENILHLRYKFVNVVLNITDELQKETKVLGVYALEEFFDKRLIEHNQRREGIILKIDEDPLWQERSAYRSEDMTLAEVDLFKLSALENMDILPFGKSGILQDSSLHKQFMTARHLFKSFIDKKLPLSQVFDIKKLARYNAICNILGANHALIHHNYRVFYNPVNSRLEPIGFDADAMKKEYYFYVYMHAADDEEYSAAYHAALEEVTSDAYFDKILTTPGLQENIKLLETAYPDYKFDGSMLQHNRKVLQASLYPVKSLNIFLEKATNNTITLSINNFNKFHAEITGLSKIPGQPFGKTFEKTIVPPKGSKVVTFKLDKNYQRLFVNKKKKKVGFDLPKDLKNVRVQYKTLGTSKIMEEKILEWPKEGTSISETDVFRKSPNAKEFDYLTFNETTKTITCQPGHHQLTRDMVIPPGYTLVVLPDTRIELATPYAKIISFSPIQAIGTAQAPISFFTKPNFGKGLLFLNCQDTSVVRHCKFENLSTPNTKGWVMSGAVNFYDAPVKLSNCAFTNNNSEDALNIINSYFEMDNIVFQNTKSDAFDGDFVEGIIRNSIFNNIGNDAIDISGSDIVIDNVAISTAGDKGLSAGEDSRLIATNIVIKNSEIAVACKDKSFLQLSNSLLQNNHLGFTAFQKKSEFGSATIEADSIQLMGNKIIHLIETRSSLSLNGEKMPTNDKVVEQMYGAEFGRKSE